MLFNPHLLLHMATTPPQPKSEADYAADIKATYQKGIAGHVETGKKLIEAKSALKLADKRTSSTTKTLKDFIEGQKLPFGKRQAEKMIRVAGNAALADSANHESLPNDLDTLSKLADLTDQQIRDNLGDKIAPNMKREEVATTIAIIKGDQPPQPKQSDRTRATGAAKRFINTFEKLPAADRKDAINDLAPDDKRWLRELIEELKPLLDATDHQEAAE